MSIEFPVGRAIIDFDGAPGLPFAQPGQVAILGRDVLARAILTYDGLEGVAGLRFGKPARPDG